MGITIEGTGRARRCLVAATIAGACSLGARAAHADDVAYLQLEGGGTFMLSAAQSERYGAGGYASARLGLRLVGPVGVHATVGYFNWTAKDAQASPGTLALFGGGLSIAPRLSPTLGRLSFELDGGLGMTGAEGRSRFTFSAGVGWLIPLGRPVSIGPFVRYHQLVTISSEGNDPRWLTAGVAVAFPGRPAPPDPPPPDTDGDGVIDAEDLCPSLPRGANPDRTRRGCPVGDRDGDGALDTVDRCPDVPAGPSPHPQHLGCPGPTVAASCPPAPPPPACPACPTCPPCSQQVTVVQQAAPTPTPQAPAQPPAAVVENGRININDSIYFDTGTAVIQARSFGILDAVARALTEHPEILRVSIEGHTDDVGNARRNLRLSRDRARSVERYLRQRGIDRGRLRAEGFGSTRPTMPGTTEDARARNRRVEFIILEGPGGAPGEGRGHHRRHH